MLLVVLFDLVEAVQCLLEFAQLGEHGGQNHKLIDVMLVSLAHPKDFANPALQVIANVERVGIGLLHEYVEVETIIHNFGIALAVFVLGDV